MKQHNRWDGALYFGDCWCVFFGKSASNTIHSHSTLQLTIAHNDQETVQIQSQTGELITAPGILVKAGIKHTLLPCHHVIIIHIEPQSQMAASLINLTSKADISALPSKLIDKLQHVTSTDSVQMVLDSLISIPLKIIDERVSQALTWLTQHPSVEQISVAAQKSGLSPSRLRTLTKSHLGVPLTQWITWRKLELSAKALARGEKLVDAAFAGGFSDQAHYCRKMRQVFGIQPKEALGVLADK